jgi:hypothetical protein
MTSIANSVVTIQTSPQSVPSPPSWLGELTVFAHFLKQRGIGAWFAGWWIPQQQVWPASDSPAERDCSRGSRFSGHDAFGVDA